MSYSNITGIGRFPVHRIEGVTLAQYDGQAKPGELVVDKTTKNLYVAANTGNHTIDGGGGGGGSPAGVSGDIQFNTAGAFAANSTFQFDDTTGTLSVNAIEANTLTMTGDILPSSDNAYSLGSNAMQWKELWVSGNTIYLDGTPLSVQSNSTIAFGGNTLLTTDETGGMNVTEMSVAGNITAEYLMGNGSQLTGLAAGSNYGNANLANIGSNAIGTTGNITSGNISVGRIGDPVAVTDYSATGTQIAFSYDGLLSPMPFNPGDQCILANTGVSGVDGIYTVTAGYSYGFTAASSKTAGSGMFGWPYPQARYYTPGSVSVVGNVSSDYFIGNGALLTGISSGGGSSNATANLFWQAAMYSDISNIDGAGLVLGDASKPVSSITYTVGNGWNADGKFSAASDITTGAMVRGLNVSATGTVTGSVMRSIQSSGNEGGEVFLNKAAANTTIDTGVVIDVYQNRLRFFEAGGNGRGAYIDIGNLTNGVNTNLVSTGGSSTLNVVSANTALTLTAADSGKYYVLGTGVVSLSFPVGAPIGTYYELAAQSNAIYFFAPGSETIQFAVGGFGPSNLDQFVIGTFGYARMVKTSSTNWVLTGENLSVAS